MNPSNQRNHQRAGSTERPILMVIGLTCLAAVPIGLMIFANLGNVSGREFSPNDFTRRQFSYHQLPWLNLTISGIDYSDITPELEQSLVTDGLIERRFPPTGQSKTWHLFWDSGTPDSHRCDARFLTAYLDFADWDSATATSKPYWLTWNEKHPDSAKFFWPTIADLARNEMYLVIPNIMRFAMDRADDNATQFQAELESMVYEGWFQAGKAALQKGEFELATGRLLRANEISATDEIELLLNQCRKQIDNFQIVKTDATKAANELSAAIKKLTEPSNPTTNQSASAEQAEADETATDIQ